MLYLLLQKKINQKNTSCLPTIYRYRYEEDVEEGGDRWSKPHVATLSLYSLFELRSSLMAGTVILDMEATTLNEISGKLDYSSSLFLGPYDDSLSKMP